MHLFRKITCLTVAFLTLLIGLYLTSAPTQAVETSVYYFSIFASQPFVDTGVDFQAGDYIDFKTVVGYMIIPGMTVPWISTPGDPGCTAGPTYIIPGVYCYSLIARFGENNPFHVGFAANLYVAQSGRLYLAVNHPQPWGISQGTGSWNIRVIRNYSIPPAPPTPFLELPWDYTNKNMAFGDAALAINSYFDHEYPLLSAGLGEPSEALNTTTLYRGDFRTDFDYSSHDGYDYGMSAEVRLGDPVLAAASGCAYYRYTGGPDNTWAGGNEIHIIHNGTGQGYQTRYFHLLAENLITKETDPTKCVNVTQGQWIGNVGSTGHSTGPHLHFMVIQDKNHDGDFDDNIPDGVTDPFGWQSTLPDPWPGYTFNYNGLLRSGNQSYYLWLHPVPNLDPKLFTNGGVFQLEQYKLNFPSGATNQTLNLHTIIAPIQKISDAIVSLGTSFVVTATDLFGNSVNTFQQPFTLTIDFSDIDLTKYNQDTLKIYSSSDGSNWQPEVTTIDFTEKTASAQLNHLTQFALFAEKLDAVPPQTTIYYNGITPPPAQLAPPVNISLAATDSSQVAYSLYRFDDGDWQEYAAPFTAESAGLHTLEYYSVDTADNIETIKSETFTIVTDTIPPETSWIYDRVANDVAFTGLDEHLERLETTPLGENLYQMTVTDTYANTFRITYKKQLQPAKLKLEITDISYNNQAVSPLIPTRLYVENRSDTSGVLKRTSQSWVVWDQTKVKIEYNADLDQSRITKLENGQETVETKPGFVPLQITTNQGMLNFSY
ncbi:MAG: hypothetical protein UV61_C0006G0017 [Candidatus Gottesmanbacteria bacterium GW2011_GWB1_43_11]|uniref:M23ase beta-sheet core domain-containing protein n=1 Tax=Candidatus Gottesmanbacteria bacterium GW2011_GWB1_43_11 TaxID=1618446 RepID=A0A0G1EUV5_9BACT|nr:MAG: hypothetical protein UV61_C0006G0017 [Candidatus Gottesmanbacteria bacterium GW2011_GWB1_43_11]